MTRKPYTVAWNRVVQDAYTEHWVQSSSRLRRLLTQLSNEIDRTLGMQPHSVGFRVVEEPGVWAWPLAGELDGATVYFEIIEDDRVVRVVRITMQHPWGVDGT